MRDEGALARARFVPMQSVYEMLGYPAPKRVVVLGIHGSGKTSAVERIKDAYSSTARGLRPDQIIPTVGMNMARVSGTHLPMEMTFWDLGGAFGLRGIWENYFAEADACAYVVDGADEDALEEAMVELERALRNKKFSKRMPVLILSSKIDLSGPEGLEMVRASCEDVFARVDASPSSRSWSVFPVDAHRGLGVKPAIEWLTSALAPTHSYF